MINLSFPQPLMAAGLLCALVGACVVVAGVSLRRRNYAGPSLSLTHFSTQIEAAIERALADAAAHRGIQAAAVTRSRTSMPPHGG